RVGESSVNRLALGAAIGTVAASRIARATGCDGTRTATVSSPAVTMSGTNDRFGTTSVSGPGQKASARRSAARGHSRATARAAEAFNTCTISGSYVGRPFAAKIRATAFASNVFAASPYT